MLVLSVGVGGMIALSCASSGDQVSDYSAFAPASSQQRAEARRERQARQKALAELSARPDAGVAPEAPPPPEPPPPPPVAEAVDAGVDAADAAPTDAGAVVDAGPADAGPAPPSAADMCDKLCARAMACVREMMGNAPPGLGDGMLEDMVKKVGEECATECAKEVKEADAEQMKKAQECLDVSDCDAFMTCMRELRGEDGEKAEDAP